MKVLESIGEGRSFAEQMLRSQAKWSCYLRMSYVENTVTWRIWREWEQEKETLRSTLCKEEKEETLLRNGYGWTMDCRIGNMCSNKHLNFIY